MNEAILNRLLQLIERLYAETAEFQQHSDDAQLWYNRGYANGMLEGLDQLGYRDLMQSQLRITPDPGDVIADQAMLPWGQAYQHGFEMGSKETHEVLPDRR